MIPWPLIQVAQLHQRQMRSAHISQPPAGHNTSKKKLSYHEKQKCHEMIWSDNCRALQFQFPFLRETTTREKKNASAMFSFALSKREIIKASTKRSSPYSTWRGMAHAVWSLDWFVHMVFLAKPVARSPAKTQAQRILIWRLFVATGSRSAGRRQTSYLSAATRSLMFLLTPDRFGPMWAVGLARIFQIPNPKFPNDKNVTKWNARPKQKHKIKQACHWKWNWTLNTDLHSFVFFIFFVCSHSQSRHTSPSNISMLVGI